MDYKKLEEDKEIIISENGIEKKYPVAISFDCEQNGKTYLGYTEEEKNGEVDIHFLCYDTDFYIGQLFEPSTEEELELIRDVVEQVTGQTGRKGK